MTGAANLEWAPAALADGKVAYIKAGAQDPAAVAVMARGGVSRKLDMGSAKDYPSSMLVVPSLVSFKSPDGLTIQGQLFRQPGSSTQQPGVILVHGGPPRQMLLGRHYMDYYSNAYAVNEYLATYGFTVLSVWVPALAKDGALPEHWYETDGAWKEAIATAFVASPDADIATWKSPVLLIQEDDNTELPVGHPCLHTFLLPLLELLLNGRASRQYPLQEFFLQALRQEKGP